MEDLIIDQNTIELLKYKSVFALGFDPDSLDTIFQAKYLRKVSAGKTVTREGSIPTSLIIPIDKKISLISQKQSNMKVGETDVGRGLNLYSVLRKSKYLYSAIAEEETLIFEMPLNEFHDLLDQHPRHKIYLTEMTGSIAIRKIASSLEVVGCSSLFKVDLISRLKFASLDPQYVIQNQDDVSHFAFFITQGEVQAFKSKQDALTPLWIVPHQSWISLSETFHAKRSAISYRTLSSTEIYQLTADDIKEIQKNNPEDFSKLLSWIETLASKNSLKINDENEELDAPDLEDLFKVSFPNAKKIWDSYPWVAQNDEMDCGPACLAMIAKYYGKTTQIQFWRAQVGTDREGTSLFDLARVAEKFGFITHGMSVDQLQTIDKKMLPAIVFKKLHYLVLYEITKTQYIFGDPALGIRKIPHAEFEESFSRVVLFMKPTEKIHELKEQKAGYGHYWGLISGFERELGFALACAVIGAILTLIPPFLNQYLFDDVLMNKDFGALKITILAIFSISILEIFTHWARGTYLLYFYAKFDYKAKSAFIRKMMALPFHFFMARHTGDFTRRIGEMEKIRNFLTNTLMGTALDLVTMTICLAVVYAYNVRLGLLITILCPGFFVISRIFSKKLALSASEVFSKASEEEGYLTDLVKGLAAIKTTTSEISARWKYEQKLTRTIRQRSTFLNQSNILNAFTEGYYQFAKYSVVGFSVYLCLTGEITIGQTVAIATLVSQILAPFFSLGRTWPQIKEVEITLNRLNDIFLAPSEEIEPKTKIADDLKGNIEFRNVWFRYGGESTDWVLQDVSFKVEPGHHIALVGASGSGKSTVAALLGRLHEPTKGQIFIDGRDYREYDLNWLRTRLGLVLQDPKLFQGTISQNVAFTEVQAKEADVLEAVRISVSDEFVNKKFSTYDYYIGPEGLGLSGGEKQRLALARTLYQRPNILVLDEATSALDGISETKLLLNLKSYSTPLTIVSIAHRFSTVQAADYAIVMSEGRIVGFGTHEELKERNFTYRALFGFNDLDKKEKNIA